jgi:hypothetical protein
LSSLAQKNAQVESGKKYGRQKKFASDKDRYDFHNSRKKEKRAANREKKLTAAQQSENSEDERNPD